MLMIVPQAATTTDAKERSAELTDRIGYLLKHTQLRFQEIQRQVLSPLGLDGRLLAVLIVAGHGAPCQQSHLAETLGVDRTTMVDLVDQLETSGWVQRRPDPDDRRARLVHLTPQGRKAQAAGTAASNEIEHQFLSALPSADQRAFRRMLKSLI